VVAAEIWDWFDDVGAALRGLDAKVSMLEKRLTSDRRPELLGTDPDWRVRGLFVVRDTRRNRSLVAELRPLFAARFDNSSVGWIRALGHPSAPMPDGHGFVWSDRRLHLFASRLGPRER
jgi:hypothetical protein